MMLINNVSKIKSSDNDPLQADHVSFQPILYLLILIGIFLTVYQYLLNRSLWLDEVALALNIVQKNFAELTKPLDYNQVAPIGFLYFERLFVTIFGKNELSLRLFPLLSFLVSIPLFYRLSNKLFNDKFISLLATALYSNNLSLIYYASEVKQYSIDVLVAILILHETVSLNFQKRGAFFLYTLLGVVTIWFSNVAIIMLSVSGMYLFYIELYKKRNFKLMAVFLLWGASFLIYFYLFIHNHPTKELMVNHWKYAFLPLNIFNHKFYIFIFWSIKVVYSLFRLGYLFKLVAILFSAISIFFMYKEKKYRLLYFIFSPIILHLLISSFELYPFKNRLILYITPLVVLLLSYGLYITFNFKRESVSINPGFMSIVLVIIFCCYPVLRYYPIEREEIKETLTYLQDKINPNDEIYINHGAKMAYKFYQNYYQFENKIIYGKRHSYEKHLYDNQLKNLKGKTWILFSHQSSEEEKYIITYLLHNGAKQLDFKRAYGTSVYYFDLNP